jgi:dTDP-4-dehydrorhamnose reductase
MSKYGGDCSIEALARKYYIFRIPLLFGENPKENQFVEKMVTRLQQGETELHISNDIVSSPSFSTDIAQAIKGIVNSQTPYGLYHLANEGQASLYDLIMALVGFINSNAIVNGCSHTSFPSKGIKNTFTPIRSIHLPPLRPWQAALSEYCSTMLNEVNHD